MPTRHVRGCFTLFMVFALGAQAKGLDHRALEAWLQKYEAAWETRDAAAAGRLFTGDATYHDNAFEPADRRRELRLDGRVSRKQLLSAGDLDAMPVDHAAEALPRVLVNLAGLAG